MTGHGTARPGWPLAAGGLVIAVLGLSLWSEQAEMATSPGHAWASVTVGVGFAVTAAIVSRQEGQRRNALVLALGAFCWVASRLSIRDTGWPTAPLFVLGSAMEVVAAAALLCYPSPRMERLDRRFVVVSACLAIMLAIPIVLTTSRENLGYPDAPWPNLWDDAGASTFFQNVRSTWLGVSAVVFLVLLARRWRRLVRLERRTLTPILVTAALSGLLTVLILLRPLLRPGVLNVLYIVRSYAAAALAVAFVVSAVELVLSRGALLPLVGRLGEARSVEEVQHSLRATLDDQTLELWYFVTPDRFYVDTVGMQRSPQDLDPQRMFIEVNTSDGDRLAAVHVDGRLERHRDLVRAAVDMSRLALEATRLEAGLRAQLVAVQQARGRLLSAGLAERRRLERDLHDGAQQRILGATMKLSAIEAGADHDTAEAVEAVRSQLHLALEELRSLARGIYPAVLTQAGLGPALESVAEDLPIPVHATVPARRWSPDVESAAYLVACEALTNIARHAGPCRVELLIDSAGDDLHLRIVDDGMGSAKLTNPGALRKLNDRVTALGGRLDVRSTVSVGTVMEVWIPCA